MAEAATQSKPKRAAKGQHHELVQQCGRRLNSLETQRLSWFYAMRELATYIQPRLGRFFETPNEGNRGSRDGHVFNLGHGMSPDMDPEHVAALVQAVHELSAR